MDIDKIQKMNALAVNLMKQGLAVDREDAVEQAEKFFHDKSGDDYEAIRQATSKGGSATMEAARSSLDDNQIKSILEQNSQYLVKKIREFQDKIDAMDKEVAMLKSRFSQASRPVAAEQPRPVQQASSAPPSSGGSGPATGDHPRSGNFKEADVSIEKIFYMGHK